MAVPGPGMLGHQDSLAEGQLRGAELGWGISAQPDPHRVPRAHLHSPSSLRVLQLSLLFHVLCVSHWAQRSWVEKSPSL